MDIIKESPIEDLEIENNEINIKLEDNNDILIFLKNQSFYFDNDY